MSFKFFGFLEDVYYKTYSFTYFYCDHHLCLSQTFVKKIKFVGILYIYIPSNYELMKTSIIIIVVFYFLQFQRLEFLSKKPPADDTWLDEIIAPSKIGISILYSLYFTTKVQCNNRLL